MLEEVVRKGSHEEGAEPPRRRWSLACRDLWVETAGLRGCEGKGRLQSSSQGEQGRVGNSAAHSEVHGTQELSPVGRHRPG